MKLPSAIPTRKTESIVTNAWVELPTMRMSTRVQITSSARETTPESAIASRTQRLPGTASTAPEPSGSAAAEGPPWRERTSAHAPTATFTATAIQRAG